MRKFTSIISACCVVLFSASFIASIQDIEDIPALNTLKGVFQNKCIDDLGCFYTGPPFFHPIYRPISVPPSQNLSTQFLLYTPMNPNDSQVLMPTEESLRTSTLDPNLETKILIHGYTTRLDPDDVRFRMKDELLNHNPMNVIIVNWTKDNKSPYPKAVANARAVGCQVAKLINYHVVLVDYLWIDVDKYGCNEVGDQISFFANHVLKAVFIFIYSMPFLIVCQKLISKPLVLEENMNMDPKTVHVIGHSLGAQMSGWIGEKVPGLGRITGLDPAGPWFQKAPPEVRLDTTDAEFVDIIHTNGGEIFIQGLGINEAIGHLDFYPNGGNDQPGCFYAALILTGGERNKNTDLIANSCDHSRASFFFLDSINRCQFVGVQCKNYKDFREGRCAPENSYVALMGYHATKLSIPTEKTSFYLQTTEQTPFCGESDEIV